MTGSCGEFSCMTPLLEQEGFTYESEKKERDDGAYP